MQQQQLDDFFCKMYTWTDIPARKKRNFLQSLQKREKEKKKVIEGEGYRICVLNLHTQTNIQLQAHAIYGNLGIEQFCFLSLFFLC